jgi:stage V sporulation protein R
MMDYSLDVLEEWDEKICKLAKGHNLDWYDIAYETLDYYSMIGAMSYHGLPTHFDHWSYGKTFEQTFHRYNLGMEGLPYELIINSDPSIAYLMRENPLYLQILIMAHCVGHSDFFKNNRMFKNTRAHTAVPRFRAAKKRIQSYIENPNIGVEAVEDIIDSCHAVQFQTTKYGQVRRPHAEIKAEYIELINNDKDGKYRNFNINAIPLEPDYDVLGFISENAKIPDWKRDIIDVCRDEGQYFWPQIQTKVMNEGWACVTGDTLIDTIDGLVTAKSLVEGRTGKVFDGTKYQDLIEWHHNPRTERIKITTDKGYVIHGSKNHRIWTGSEWKYLSDIKLLDELPINKGNSTWGGEYQNVENPVQFRMEIGDICELHGVSYRQVRRYVNGKPTRASLEKLSAAHEAIESNKTLHLKNDFINFPRVVCEKSSNIVGMLIGDGGFYKYSNERLKSGFTSGDDELKDLFCSQIYELFNVLPAAKRDENKWRVGLGSDLIVKWFFEVFGFETGNTASKKRVPEIILKSPKSVVAAFLRGLFDTDGCADKGGSIIYVTASEVLAHQIQEILLKFGIVSNLSHSVSDNPAHQDAYRLWIGGADAELFRKEIGFNLKRKQDRLEEAFKNKKWWKNKSYTMKVVDIEHDIGEVYDFTVNDTHQYRASAFMNHNSHWHYHILHELDLPDGMHIPFIKMHNQVVRPHIGAINPYHLGFHLFQKIKERHGIEECFLAREVCHDAAFLRQYLTEEDCVELNLFTYSTKRREGVTIDEVSDDIGWEEVKEDLVKQVGGGSIPAVYVDEVRRDGTLVVRHEHDGRDLELTHAKEVVGHLKTLWGNEVQFFTVIEDEPWEI